MFGYHVVSIASQNLLQDRKVLTDVRVPENEPRAQFILQPVHLTSNNAEQRLAVNQHLDTILLDRLIERSRLVHIFQMVGQPAASSVLNTDTDEFAVRRIKESVELRDGQWSESDGSFPRAKFALLRGYLGRC